MLHWYKEESFQKTVYLGGWQSDGRNGYSIVQSELGVNCTPLQFACSKSNLLAKSVLDEARLVRILETHLFGHMHTDCLDKSDCGYIMLCLHVIPLAFKCLLH